MDKHIREFLSAVDPYKDVRRNVTRMYRVKALDFLTDPDKPTRREFLTVVEDWYGKRADGTDVPPVRDHKNGVYNELKVENGEPAITGNLIYYIPFSKEEVDEWIDQSWITDKESIEFRVDTKQGSKRKQFDYDDFVNLSWEELVQRMDNRNDTTNKTIETLTSLVQRQQQQIDALLEVKKK